jgi:hypothetical protein
VLGAVPLAQGLALVRAVLERFLDLASPTQTRMRQLLEVYPTADFVAGWAWISAAMPPCSDGGVKSTAPRGWARCPRRTVLPLAWPRRKAA